MASAKDGPYFDPHTGSGVLLGSVEVPADREIWDIPEDVPPG